MIEEGWAFSSETGDIRYREEPKLVATIEGLTDTPLCPGAAKQWFIERIGGMELDSGIAPQFLLAKEYLTDLVEHRSENGMTAINPKQMLCRLTEKFGPGDVCSEWELIQS
jgi:hypothetical protein